MCSAQVPKPLRWGVVGAWLTLSVFRPAVGAAIFIAVLSAIACCALLGAYARSLQRRGEAPPWICTALRAAVRYLRSPRRLAALCAIGCAGLLLTQLPKDWSDPAWLVSDTYAERDHAAPGGAAPPEGPGLERRRWAGIANAYETAVASQWAWKLGDGDASVKRATAEWHAFLAHVPPAPARFSNRSAAAHDGSSVGRQSDGDGGGGTPLTRGIVISAGGAYLEPAFISVYVLRQMHHYGIAEETLPVEIWTSRRLDGVMAPQLRSRLESLPRVTVHYFEDHLGGDTMGRLLSLQPTASAPPGPSRPGRPFALKVLALLLSSFDEALLLDADNIPAADPAPLFHSKEFDRNGAIFWPDFWRVDEGFGAGREAKATDASALRLIFSYEEEAGMQTVESGQVLIDKRRGWTALLLTLFVVLRADHYAQPMREMYNVGADGDRQAFPVAWKALSRPYHLVVTAPASAGYRLAQGGAETELGARKGRQGGAAARGGLWCGATEVQHDLHGRPLFLHRTMDKLNKRSVRPAGAAPNAPRVTPWKTVQHWSSNEVGVWGETRVEYGCTPRSTLWLAGNTTDADFVEYFRGTKWAQNLNAIIEEALDHLPASP